MKQHDQLSTEKEDPRFRIAHREAWIGVALAVFNFLWWFGFAYGLGDRPPAEYTYILGLPAWFFYSCVLGLLVMIVLVWLVTKFVLQDVSFEEGEVEERHE